MEGQTHHLLCIWDSKTSPVRFYEIDVKVTDIAGNIGSLKAIVIILPRGYSEMSKFYNAPGFENPTFFIDMVKLTPTQNFIQSKIFQLEVCCLDHKYS